MADIEVSTQLYSQAATLMFVGMGFVFAFLGLLIVVIRLFISPLAKKYPDKIPQNSKTTHQTNGEQPAVVAAITAAITQYRHKHK